MDLIADNKNQYVKMQTIKEKELTVRLANIGAAKHFGNGQTIGPFGKNYRNK